MEKNKNKNIVIRRDFLKSSIMTSIGLLIGTNIVFASNFPKGLLPIGVLDGTLPSGLIGKSDKLTILNDRPVNAETPAHLLNDDLTPNNLFFVRNNGLPPNKVDVNKWSLTFEGESVKNKKTFSIGDLKSKFKHYTYNITLECGGNGRSEFNPPAKVGMWRKWKK